MREFHKWMPTKLLLLAVLLLPKIALAQDANATFSLLPQCATDCIFLAASQNSCVPSDKTCLCGDSAILDQATWCIRDSCTAKETLYSKNVTSTSCQLPIRDKGDVYATTSDTLGVITGAFIIVRCAYRIFIVGKNLAADDWLALFTTIAGVPCTVINKYGLVANGLGRDVWTLPYDMVYSFGKFLYAMEILYFIDIILLKVALLVFYLRIFPSTGVRHLLWATVAVTAVFGAVFVFLAVFQCRPISYYWTRWDGEHTGSCLNINAITWAHAAISIAVDLWMLAIPMAQLRGLRLHWKKKIGVAIMFCVGTFVTVVSILRLQSLLNFANSINPTWEDYEISNWSTIEINVGIICSCMPSFRLLLVHFFPTLLGSDTGKNSYHKHSNFHDGRGHEGPQSNGGAPYVIPLVDSPNAQRIPSMDVAAGAPEKRAAPKTLEPVCTPSPLDRHHSQGDFQDRIMCSKSYVVEYGVDYHDQARLVQNGRRGPIGFTKNVFKNTAHEMGNNE